MGSIPQKLPATATLIVGLILASYAACAPDAYAEDRPVPAGTKLELPDGERMVLTDRHYLLTRDSLDRINATAAMERRLTRALTECSATLAKQREPTPSWQLAGWAALWGLSVGAAFTLGVLL